MSDSRRPGARSAWLRARAGIGALDWAHLWPMVLILGAALVAYHFTLSTFLDNLSLDTPLAYLPLLPLIAIWASWEAAGRYRGRPAPIRDRQLDLILALPLLLVALFLISVTPVLWGTFYWSLRPDVLSFALFVTGAVVLAYGVGWAWRMRAPLLLLFLMWPALYISFLSGLLSWFVRATDSVLGLITTHLALGVSQVAGDPSLLVVHPALGSPVQISVSTACAGGDGVLGFLLIGGALLTAVTGPVSGRLLWLLAGLLLTFVLNVGRIVAIALLASAGQATFALGGFHEVIGLVLFGLGTAAMLWLLPGFRLARPAGLGQPAGPPASRERQGNPRAAASPTGRPAATDGLRGMTWRRSLKVASAALGIGLFLAADQSLGLYAGYATGSGVPTVEAMTTGTAVPRGWQLGLLTTYPWGTEYFGAGSSYVRYQLTRPGGPAGDAVLWADVVTTPDDSALLTYTVENCFLFHNYDIVAGSAVALGHGVTALLLNYSDPATRGQWATLTWTWPVRVGGTTAYERIELTSPLVPGSVAPPDLQPAGGPVQDMVVAVENFFSGSPSPAHTPGLRRYQGADSALTSFGAEFVAQSLQPVATRA